MKLKIDINCDVGEGFGRSRVSADEKIMPLISSANVACGLHAGNPVLMARTVKLAKEERVAVGAHPGFPDLMGFGRRYMELTNEEVKNNVIYQVGALDAIAKTANVDLQHVKPHGALYNTAAGNEEYAKTIVEALKALNSKLILFALADSKMAKIAVKAGLRVAHEVFADRAYNSDGTLTSRNVDGSVIRNAKTAAERAVKMVKERYVTAIDGRSVTFDKVHTICFHGDTSNVQRLVKSTKEALRDADVEVAAVSSFL